ncbi:APC family permease [Saccharopolyspora indica]|uniref:APC family permease n=1 Tax=Saccharopolyspora indica TaxID=1229659 RepID=UPI0022EA2EDD|nr:APC family permease [Saccharopolyspora indica]MDA3643890.1 APC family permease [Saccharopolyspora indica]
MPGKAAGRQKLKYVDAIAQSVGFLGPVFSASILLILLVDGASGKSAGAAAPLSVLLATAGVLALGWIVAQFAKRIHTAGSLYSYVTAGLGVRIGGATGLVYYLGVLMLGSALGVYIGGYLHDTLRTEFGTGLLPVWCWQVVMLTLAVSIAYIGVHISIKAQLVLALVSMLVLVGFFVFLIVHAGPANSAVAFTPAASPDGWSGVLFGVLYGVLLFTGFEAAANLAEETEDPGRNIPRAVITSVVIAAAFFLLATYSQVAALSFDLREIQAAIGSGQSPLVFLGGPGDGFGSVALRRVLELVVLLDMVAVYLGVVVSASRGISAISRDGWLPKRLAVTSARRGTPAAAIGVVTIFVLAWIVVSNVAARPFGDGPGYFATFHWVTTFGGFTLMVVYLLLSLGAVRGLRGHRRPASVWVASTVGAVLTGGAIFGSLYGVPAPTVWAPCSSLIVFAVVLAVTAARRRPAAG